MTKKELLEKLANVKDSEDVTFVTPDGCCGEYLYLEVNEIDIETYKDHSWARIEFNTLPGYYSCIQAGGTLTRHNEYWKDHNKSEYLIKQDRKKLLKQIICSFFKRKIK